MLDLECIGSGSRRITLDLNQYVLKIWYKSNTQHEVEREFYIKNGGSDFVPSSLYITDKFLISKKYITKDQIEYGDDFFEYILLNSTLGQSIMEDNPDDADDQYNRVITAITELTDDLSEYLSDEGYSTCDMHGENIAYDLDTGAVILIDAGCAYKYLEKPQISTVGCRVHFNIGESDVCINDISVDNGSYTLFFNSDMPIESYRVTKPEYVNLPDSVYRSLLSAVIVDCRGSEFYDIQELISTINESVDKHLEDNSPIYYLTLSTRENNGINLEEHEILINSYIPTENRNKILGKYMYIQSSGIGKNFNLKLHLTYSQLNFKGLTDEEILKKSYYLIDEILDYGFIASVEIYPDALDNEIKRLSAGNKIKSF